MMPNIASPSPPGKARQTMSPVVFTFMLLLFAAGCSSKNPDSQRPRPQATGRAGATVSPSPTPENPAVATYVAMWGDFATAALTSDWQSSQLSVHATGDALLEMSKSLYTDHYNGLVGKGQPVLHPFVKSATPSPNPTTVLISDCGDSTHWLRYVQKTGQLSSGETGGRRSITAEVVKQADGSWKVDKFAVEGLGSC